MSDSIASFLMIQQLRSHSARVGDHGSEVDFYRPKHLQEEIKKELSVPSISNSETETVAKIKTERNFEAKKIAEKAAKVGRADKSISLPDLHETVIDKQNSRANRYIFIFLYLHH